MKVQVAGYKGKGFGGSAIKWFSNGDYSHVSLVFTHNDGLREEIEAIQFKGVRTQEFKPRHGECDLFDFEQTEDQAYGIYESARSRLGNKYDWAGIWGLIRRRKRENADKEFCSELCAACLQENDIIIQNMPAFKQIPVIFCASTKLTRVLRRTAVTLAVMLCGISFGQINTITNGSAFSTWRTQINETIEQSNTNVLDIVATSNAFVLADSGITSAYIAADIVVMAGYEAADTSVSNAFVAADTSLSGSLTSAYLANDTIVSNALAAVDTILGATNVVQNGRLDALEAGGGIPAGSVTETELSVSVNTSLDLADSAVQPTDSVITLSDVSNAGSGAIITSLERSAINTASQPADLTSLSNDLTTAYTDADTVLSNALVGAGVSAYGMVNSVGLLSAHTFDNVVTNDWWGEYHLTDNNSMRVSYDTTLGSYVNPTGIAGGMYLESTTYTLTSDWAIAFNFRSATNAGSPNIVAVSQSTAGFYSYISEATDTFTMSLSNSTKAQAGIGDTWHNVIISYDATADLYTGYFDGASWITESADETVTSTMLIAQSVFGAEAGKICNVGPIYVFERTLSSDEAGSISGLMKSGRVIVNGLRNP